MQLRALGALHCQSFPWWCFCFVFSYTKLLGLSTSATNSFVFFPLRKHEKSGGMPANLACNVARGGRGWGTVWSSEKRKHGRGGGSHLAFTSETQWHVFLMRKVFEVKQNWSFPCNLCSKWIILYYLRNSRFLKIVPWATASVLCVLRCHEEFVLVTFVPRAFKYQIRTGFPNSA